MPAGIQSSRERNYFYYRLFYMYIEIITRAYKRNIMKSTIHIDVTSFYRSEFQRLKWTLNDQTENESVIAMEDESVTSKREIREAIEDHIDHITAALPENRHFNDYEITLSFSPHFEDKQKEEFTDIFNEFNTRDESS